MRFKDIPEIKEYLSQGKAAKYIYLKEYECHYDNELPTIFDEKHKRAILRLFKVFDKVREKFGEPILITSGYRSKRYQEILRAKGFKAATISPHTLGIALDLKPFAFSKDKLLRILELFKKYEPDIRYGIVSYNYRFLHVDVAYLLPLGKMQNSGILPRYVERKGTRYPLNSFWRRGINW